MNNFLHVKRWSAGASILIALVSLLALSGCINLKPSPIQMRQYLLGSELTDNASLPDGKGLYVMRPNLPDYLRSLKLSYTNGAGALLAVPQARWGEPLEIGLARKLAESLMATTLVDAAGMYPWPMPEDADRLSIDVYLLNAKADGSFDVSVDWVVTFAEGRSTRGRYQTDSLTWDVADADSYVAALNQALDGLIETVLNEAYK